MDNSILNMNDLEICFNEAAEFDSKFVGVLIKMEGFEKPEIIVNQKENHKSKLAYYKKAYSDDLTLRTFTGIKIIDFGFGDSMQAIEDDLLG